MVSPGAMTIDEQPFKYGLDHGYRCLKAVLAWVPSSIDTASAGEIVPNDLNTELALLCSVPLLWLPEDNPRFLGWWGFSGAGAGRWLSGVLLFARSGSDAVVGCFLELFEACGPVFQHCRVYPEPPLSSCVHRFPPLVRSRPLVPPVGGVVTI